MMCRLISELHIRLSNFIEYSASLKHSLEFWLPLMVKLFNPLQPIYIFSNTPVEDSALPTFYLFPGATVLYKNREHSISSVGNGGVYFGDQFVSIRDKSLSINPSMFQNNFFTWANSLQVGELIDVCSVDTNKEWTIGIVESTTIENDILVSLSVVVEKIMGFDTDLLVENGSPFHTVIITDLSHRSIGRPFLR